MLAAAYVADSSNQFWEFPNVPQDLWRQEEKESIMNQSLQVWIAYLCWAGYLSFIIEIRVGRTGQRRLQLRPQMVPMRWRPRTWSGPRRIRSACH